MLNFEGSTADLNSWLRRAWGQAAGAITGPERQALPRPERQAGGCITGSERRRENKDNWWNPCLPAHKDPNVSKHSYSQKNDDPAPTVAPR